jgi:hypothetical protein
MQVMQNFTSSIITESYAYITELWDLFKSWFSGKQFPDSRNPEKYGRKKKVRNLSGELQIACHNLESMMDVYQLLLPQSILTFSSNPASQKR